MGNIFLGKPLHWIMLLVVTAILYVVDEKHLHVSEFNTFMWIVLALSIACLTIVVLGHPPGERVMREPLDE